MAPVASTTAKQQADYAAAEVMRKAADSIIHQHTENPKEITPTEQKQLKLTARAIRTLTDTYCKPYLVQDDMRVRCFKQLVLVGRYYCYSNFLGSARDAYLTASKVISHRNPLRAKVQPYADELDKGLEKITVALAALPQRQANEVSEDLLMSSKSKSLRGYSDASKSPVLKKPEPYRMPGWSLDVKSTPALDSLIKVQVAPEINPNDEAL